LENRWNEDQWVIGVADKGWICHKCRGICPCKGCKAKSTRGQHAYVNAPVKGGGRKRSRATKSKSKTSSSVAEGRQQDRYAFSPTVSKRRAMGYKHRGPSPGRQPSIPDGFMNSPPSRSLTRTKNDNKSSNLPENRMGLGLYLMDASVPLHTKILDLNRQRNKCNETIAEMKNLLGLIERERDELDAALKDLVGESANGSPAKKSSMIRTSSAHNLEELAVQAEEGLQGLARSFQGVFFVNK